MSDYYLDFGLEVWRRVTLSASLKDRGTSAVIKDESIRLVIENRSNKRGSGGVKCSVSISQIRHLTFLFWGCGLLRLNIFSMGKWVCAGGAESPSESQVATRHSKMLETPAGGEARVHKVSIHSSVQPWAVCSSAQQSWRVGEGNLS